ncbi:MAG: hypothetical protein CVV64_11285 [Candidatus Wallbacteria bacterium HGW-Wallbacteria-1]|jgi:glyoxylase-like metal-dependent hydrolase (beta-lactamase superfamily II)|uniref:Metallo-beta-lactamase domain-containing protein n=1 Tax=Candidatus Wallbacteria bacterium HGW-Wallbacteria-1 TaxID=2013854 RepID=A0A2N1PP32_9BACT|nr:MAG: hypothetical protein CVV64_11285 [Candidatus Wallbacteria bacterium HGW-Wallbacteria-1]
MTLNHSLYLGEPKGRGPSTFSPGVHLLGRFGYATCGCFLLECNGETAIVETPVFGRTTGGPIRRAKSLGPKPTFVLFSHSHSDHNDGMAAYSRSFPMARPMFHSSFRSDRTFMWRLSRTKWGQKGRTGEFTGAIVRLHLGGEPLILIHAPKHSWTDVMVVFRGVMITGDWWLGKGDPNPNGIPHDVAVESCERLLEFGSIYRIHTLVSAHANDIRRGVNFLKIMDETRKFHKQFR